MRQYRIDGTYYDPDTGYFYDRLGNVFAHDAVYRERIDDTGNNEYELINQKLTDILVRLQDLEEKINKMYNNSNAPININTPIKDPIQTPNVRWTEDGYLMHSSSPDVATIKL